MARSAAFAFLVVASLTAPAFGGVDDPPPAWEGPWIVEVGPDLAVIVDGQGSVRMAGDAARRLQTCRVTAGCRALWEDGVGTVVIVDQSPAPASAASGPASKGATPR